MTYILISEGMYDPSEFEDLNVSQEIKELFNDILRYTPQAMDLETRFKPFIPEFIPAVGDIDAFIKVPRPDGQAEKTGLTVLDEPAAKQSDPSVLDLQLRAISKRSSQKQVVVKKVSKSNCLFDWHLPEGRKVGIQSFYGFCLMSELVLMVIPPYRQST